MLPRAWSVVVPNTFSASSRAAFWASVSPSPNPWSEPASPEVAVVPIPERAPFCLSLSIDSSLLLYM